MRQTTRILLLHKLTSRGATRPTALLERLCKIVPDLGLRFGTLAEALLDPGTVALTVDDGYAELLEIEPWLRGQGIIPTIFLPTGYLGKTNSWDHPFAAARKHLSAAEVQELAERGFNFGSHTHTHADLTALSTDAVERELRDSTGYLRHLLGTPPEYFAYPFGRYDARAASIAAALGYSCAFLATPGGSNAFAIGRIPLGSWDTALTMRAKLQHSWLTPIENFKCQVISAFSHLTPAVKGLSKKRRTPIPKAE